MGKQSLENVSAACLILHAPSKITVLQRSGRVRYDQLIRDSLCSFQTIHE